MLNHIIESPGVSTEQFVVELKAYAEKSRAVQHPLLDAIATGDFRDLPGAITRFLHEYYLYSHRFTQYLYGVMCNLGSPEHRVSLLPNAMEEGGQFDAAHAQVLRAAGIEPEHVAVPHPQLFERFLEAIGTSRQAILRHRPQVMTIAWIESVQSICRDSGEAQGVGALGLGTEGIVRPVYFRLMQGIARAWPDLDPRDRVFFDLHAHVADAHSEVLTDITRALATTVEGRRGIVVGVLRALAARATFFDQMLQYLRDADARQLRAA